MDWFRCRVLVDSIAFGSSLRAAAVEVEMSRPTARKIWRRSVGIPMEYGAQGGIASPILRWSAIASGVLAAALTRRRRPLTLLDREVIAIQHHAGVSAAVIGRLLGRHRSVIWRELRRNAGPDGSYFGSVAHLRAKEQSKRAKPFKLHDRTLAARVAAWMDDGWSPKLIATVLELGGDQTARVSHETIYKALYVQTRGHLRADLARQLSTKRTARKTRTATKRGKSIYADAFTISDRPAEVDDRAVPGHWEGDLIVGPASRSAIGTLVERSSRFVILLHLPGRHDADTVATVMIEAMRDLPEHLRRSITWDRGSELADYARVQAELAAPVFFCDPHSPWQRGSNENTNRLLRHWFEKGTDLSTWTAADLRRVQDTLNARPRPTLDLRTPAQALNDYLTEAA